MNEALGLILILLGLLVAWSLRREARRAVERRNGEVPDRLV